MKEAVAIAHRGGANSGRPVAAIILAGRIIDVDPLRWTCVVRTEGDKSNSRTFYDVQIGSGMYLHPLCGEGVLVMPDVGALVQICMPSEGDSPPFIVGYRSYPQRDVVTSSSTNKPVLTGRRPRMSPGDMGIVGRDRNGLFVRRGQLTEIFGGPLARTIYLGRTGEVHSIFQRLKLDALGGSVRWLVDREDEDPDGHKCTRVDARFKEYADDRGYVVRLQAGGKIDATTAGEPDGGRNASGPAPESTELVKEPVLRLRVFESGNKEEKDLAACASLCADKKGQIELALKGELRVEVRGSKNVTLSLKPDGTVSVASDTAVAVSAPKVTTTTGALEVEQTTDALKVGVGTAPVLVDSSFSSMLSAALVQMAAVATAMALPFDAMVSLQAALDAGIFTSQKLVTE